MRTTTIYALCCPDSGDERYVGKTVTTPQRRLASHWSKAKSKTYTSPLGDWLRDLMRKGKKPTVKVLARSKDDGRAEEKRQIDLLRQAGRVLLNTNRGGNGSHVRRGLPDAARDLLGQISDARIAEQFGLTRESVTYHRNREGIPPSGDRSRVRVPSVLPGYVPHNKIDLPPGVIADLGRVSDRELARRAGISRDVIRRQRKMQHLDPTTDDHRPSGEDHWASKVTREQAEAIRAEYIRYSREHGCGALARRYGLDTSTVHAIVQGRTWK